MSDRFAVYRLCSVCDITPLSAGAGHTVVLQGEGGVKASCGGRYAMVISFFGGSEVTLTFAHNLMANFMQDFIDKLLSNPLYLVIGVVLIVVLLYAVIKRVMKLLIILFIALVLFLVYVHYTGNSVKDKVERMIKD